MIELPGYEILSEILNNDRTIIYRAYSGVQQRSVIVKVLQSEYPTLEEIASLRQEYSITQSISCKNAIKSYALEPYKNSYALILEDVAGSSLKQLRESEELKLREWLRLAIAVAETLGELHQIPIIHKDIKPSNLVANAETGQIKIIDFGIANRLSVENPTISNPNQLEGTLAYMSPEQTGRMNRCVDYRTDYYAFGATLYEMLAGQVPFTTTDPMELVHCHLAIDPVPLHQLNPEIPEAVSEIVMKLLAKNAEDRYQSAAGLKYDLETCLQQLQTHGRIEKFPLGRRDRGTSLLIPQKLYGREEEVQTLLDAFDRVALGTDTPSPGRCELMLVSGYSGIGKTAIVHEVHKPIAKARGYFIAGKFDQFKRNTPYAAFSLAFAEMIRQLLTESSETIERWKQKLLEALAGNGQVIVDVIPEVELIVGPQPEVPELGPSEAQNRFNRTFQKFLSVFCQPEHPLVLFLDDLQWTDSASLKLIELLMSDPESKHLLMIGAYRDNEVDPTHPLLPTIEKIHAAGTLVNNITIGPLSLECVSELVADTLTEAEDISQGDAARKSAEISYRATAPRWGATPRTKPLAELLFNKTQGNPFFLTQLLKALYAENLLIYDPFGPAFNQGGSAGLWQWDIEEIQAVGIADLNVVELMARNLQKLPDSAQKVLKLAACIGNSFNLDVLAIVNAETHLVTAAQLWAALQAGLILPRSESYKIPLAFAQEETAVRVQDVKVDYKFLHDRVQQAAYSLIPEPERKATHLKIGQLLLQSLTPTEQRDNIFALVNQLNFGTELLTEPEAKYQLAQLNLIAGQKAKASAAYEAAASYLNVGLGLLAVDSWQSHYDLTLALYVEAVEAEYLNTNFDRSQALAEVALEQAKTLLEKVKVYEIQIQSYFARNEMQASIDLGLKVLEILGYSLEPTPPSMDIIVEELADLPVITDPIQLAAMRVLDVLSTAAFVADPQLSATIVFTRVNFCIKHGNSSLAALVYVNYAFILCGVMGEIELGYRYGELSLKILEKFHAKSLKCRIINIFNAHVRHWKEPLQETLDPLLKAIASGLETGDLTFTCISALNYCSHSLFLGGYLEEVEQKYSQYILLMIKLKQEFTIDPAKAFKQMLLNLQGRSAETVNLIGEEFNELIKLPILKEYNLLTSLLITYLIKLFLSYLFKDSAQAVSNARLAEPYLNSVPGLIYSSQYNFYSSLALLAHYPDASAEEQEEWMAKVTANQEQMKIWGEHCPSNFENKYQLVEAEKARIIGNVWEAAALYDRAIQGAKANKFGQEEAIANERAAEFHLARGSQQMGQFYLIAAYYAYIRWGAKAKVRDLESRYPQFLQKIAAQSPQTATFDVTQTASGTGSGGNSSLLDLPAAIKGALAISSELVLSQLLHQLMEIAIENAGATVGKLVLVNDNDLTVAVSGEVLQARIAISQSPVAEISEVVPLAVIYYAQRTRKSVLLNDAKTEKIYATDPYIVKNQSKSILCTPIINQGKLIGLLYLENNLTVGAFTPSRLEILKLLASQAAISIENALLYQTLEQKVVERTAQLQDANEEITVLNKRLQAENLRLRAELDIARRLQLMMLPKDSELSQIPGLEIAGFMEPAEEVGGDYYDVLTSNGKVKIGIGDVTGHGLESGVMMIMAQTAVRTLLANEETDPAKFLNAINRTIYGSAVRMNSDKNMTLVLLDYEEGALVVSGQHEEVIVGRSSGEVERIETEDLGFPIGLEEDISHFVASARVELAAGDVVVLHTDGVTEAIDVNGVQYGLKKLCEVVRNCVGLSATEIRQAVIEDLRRHIGEQTVFDDITLVVLKQK